MTTPKTPDLAAVVARVQGTISTLKYRQQVLEAQSSWPVALTAMIAATDLEALCAAAGHWHDLVSRCSGADALRVECVMQAAKELSAAQADLAALRAERDRLEGGRWEATQIINRVLKPSNVREFTWEYARDLANEIAALRERLAVSETNLMMHRRMLTEDDHVRKVAARVARDCAVVFGSMDVACRDIEAIIEDRTDYWLTPGTTTPVAARTQGARHEGE